ncbi:1-acyl-sn-glycerol-3-phosphate acyltransferase [Aureimonas flava]|uniref:1-acyl-sn-glycerol-3-phosphate acyltransferase n=1 Tax=Aureimonas flava TaxID=2320271 RepID=A0A3A1WTJ0_9HYPH|nr:lysophospholipid acyltransferase family protein [Aureimonas flava]RIY01075.1 1-acyl-sn-glycerol-3-phosphate acyltransferase [Aureimonas flava]
MTLVLAPLQLVAIRFGWRLAAWLPFLWQRVAVRVAGLRVHLRGAPATGRPLLLVSNHQSWADIMALGSVMPLSFIAKSDVEGWPVFGLLARLQRTVFVERNARGRTGAQADSIAARLGAGDAMVLFAEGTTSDGNGVLPFKTALFGAAQAALRASRAQAVLVQPVSIAYVGANGMVLGRFGRPLAAWPGDVALMPHLSAFLREGAVDVEISFGAPIRFEPGSDRKAMARACEVEVRRMLRASLGFPGDG